jgi:hypothetical protein
LSCVLHNALLRDLQGTGGRSQQQKDFLRGLIGIDDELRLLVAPRLRDAVNGPNFATFFGAYAGRSILIPSGGVQPDAAALRHHRVSHRLELHR